MEEIITKIKNAWGAKPTSQQEKDCWGYDAEYNYSLNYFIGFEMKPKKKDFICTIDEVVSKNGRMFYVSNQIKYPITTVLIKIDMPFFGTVRWVESAPARGLKLFVERGYLVDEKKYKSLYYKTDEYRNKFKKGMLKSYGVEANSPVLIDSVREKISASIQKKYGVPWFLNRGSHYDKIDTILKKTYGDTPEKFYLFGSSRLEASIIDFILGCKDISVGDELYYLSKENSQYCFEYDGKRHSVDFYDKDRNIVIEINGDYFHCNPSLYPPNYFNSAKQLKAKELWDRDGEKEKVVSQHFGVNYLTVWERDWMENRQEVEQEIINFYNENKNN